MQVCSLRELVWMRDVYIDKMVWILVDLVCCWFAAVCIVQTMQTMAN